MKNLLFEVEFYYRSGDLNHLITLKALRFLAADVGATFTFRAIDCDSPAVNLPEEIIALPCIRRIEPKPARIILGAIKSVEELQIALGLPPLEPPLGRDVFLPGRGNVLVSSAENGKSGNF